MMSNFDSWIHPKIIIGAKATGDYYFKRDLIENNIWREIEKGNHILISAPRRIGKTSIMISLTNNSKNNYKLLFKNIQGIKTEEQLYQEIYRLILQCLSKFDSNKKQIKDYFNKKGISEISLNSLKFDSKNLDYVKEINTIIPKLDKRGEKIILLLDELPEVLHTLYKAGKNNSATSILRNLRYWRQEEKFSSLKFILAGSIGIHHIINKVEGRSKDINDIKIVNCPSLTEEQFEKYLNWVIEDASIEFNNESIQHFKQKIQYFVPYFINLMLDEIDKSAYLTKVKKISNSDIDIAFNKVLKNTSHFEDWKNRLKEYLGKGDYNFANLVLTHIAHKDKITKQKLYNIAVTLERADDYMNLIFDLERDGYIQEIEDKYQFVSPFLKAYWKKANPIYKD